MGQGNKRFTFSAVRIIALFYVVLVAVITIIVAITSPTDLGDVLTGMAVLAVPILEVIKEIR